MEQINFHFDPVCPWAWLTSRWAARLEELGAVQVDWRFFSLGMVHAQPEADVQSGPVGPSGPALQMLALAAHRDGRQRKPALKRCPSALA